MPLTPEITSIELKLFGPFDLRAGEGAPLDLTGKKNQALVAYLAVESGRPHSREELAGLLWGDMDDERARHNLRQALSRIRRATHALILAEEDMLRFDPEACTVDVLEFQRLVGQDDPARLQEGLDLYRHDFLEGFATREDPFEEWLRNTRRNLRHRACAAIERLSLSLREAGHLEEAIHVLRRRLEIDAACEEAHRALMELLAETGRRSEALAQYETCAGILRDDLGAAPAPETVAVFEAIRAGRLEVPPAPASPPPAASETPSVAVLPFENLAGEEHLYFSDGITDDIITSLSRFGSLTVIARVSTFAYRDRHVPVQQIGRELGAQFVLQGSVQKAGARVRINVQLLEAEAGRHIWAHRFDRDMNDIFAVQDEVTETVVSTLAGRVEAARLATARAKPTGSLDAYDCVLRGKVRYHAHTPEDCARAVEHFERAAELDPDYAVAYAWLACALGQAMAYRPGDFQDLLERSHLVAERGCRLDDQESECYRILAQVFLLRRDLQTALTHSERALMLNPNEDRTVCGQGEILVYLGRPEEAEGWIRRAMRLNPFHPEAYHYHLGRSLFHQGRHDEALETLKRITRPRSRDLAYRAAAAVRAGDRSYLKQSVEALREASPGFDPTAFVNGLTNERESDRRDLLDALVEAGLES